MVVAAFLGMATKYSEGLLAVKYRTVAEDGHSLGGPFYYIELGMGKKFKWLAKIFAFFGVCVGLFGIGTFSQVNGISSAVHGFFDPSDAFTVKILPFLGEYSWSVVIASLILSFCVAAVLIGGVKRIASVSQIIVPFMAVIYFVFAVILICCNITKVPAAFATIVTAAFSPKDRYGHNKAADKAKNYREEVAHENGKRAAGEHPDSSRPQRNARGAKKYYGHKKKKTSEYHMSRARACDR